MAAFQIRVIKPSKFADPRKMREVIKQAYQDAGEGVKKDIEEATKTWKSPVSVDVRYPPIGGAIVTVTSPVFELVDKGVKPHTIRPKSGRGGGGPGAVRVLRFLKNYKSKSSPGKLTATQGGPSGDVVVAREVRHPGFKGRKFMLTAQKKWERILVRQVNAGIKELA